jgi:hypothetical protein
MPIDPKKGSEFPEIDTIADDDFVFGVNVSAATPALKNVRISFTKAVAWITSKFAAPSQAEAEEGTATTARLWTAQRVAQAIEALGSDVSLPDIVSQAEAEAGAETTARLWTAQRVAQAIEALAGAGVTLPDIISQAEAEAGVSTAARLWTAQRVAQAIEALASAGVSLPDIISQAEAEAGTATTARLWTAERVAQAIAALAEGGGAAFPVDDTTILVKDPVDATKQIRLDAGNLSPDTTVVLQSPGFSTVVGLMILERSVSGSPLASYTFDGFVATRPGRLMGVGIIFLPSYPPGTYPLVMSILKNEATSVVSGLTFYFETTGGRRFNRTNMEVPFAQGDMFQARIDGAGDIDVGGSGPSGTAQSGTIVVQYEIIYDPS